MLGRVALLLIATIAIAGCRGRVLDEFVAPASHPASPAAATGQPLRISRALEPEFENVQPQLQRKPATKRPAGPAGGDAIHKHHQH